jgi:branched-chain amino acid transport system substrate-binding protein
MAMKIMLAGAAALVAATLVAGPAAADGTVRIGLVMPYSGQFADGATQMEHGIKLFMQENGDTVAGKKIVLVRKDTGGINPAVAKRLSQELVVRDKVDILGGYTLTPNALAGGDVSKASRKFMVVMNAATSIITRRSPYMTRTSFTTPQLNFAFGQWAATHGTKSIYTMVSDYGPGIDAEKAFVAGFAAGGGKVIGSVRFPTQNVDFASYARRAKDSGAKGLYIWVPGGSPQAAEMGKALAERGISPQNTTILGQEELADDLALHTMGDNAIGIVSVWNYNYELKNPENEVFAAAYAKEFHRNPDYLSIGGFDGMKLIYEALKKTQGDTDGQKLIDAAKGMAWNSPRGPVSIDPATRDIIENVYVMKVEKTGGVLGNVLLDTIKDVKNPPVK